ncbi:MAG TPA: PDZ domain-containing protein [Gemmatimonadales bacterium]|nr:PDZ domain-containing protein [Gemmatimonadales bacterium]
MSSLHRLALVAFLITPLVTTAAPAQDRAKVSAGGRMTVTPDRVDQVRVLTTRRARLGITINLLASPTDSIGALIVGVTPNGPAAKAGIRSGDIIVRFNGKVMTEGDRAEPDESAPGLRLIKLAAEVNPGDTTTVLYRRDKTQRTATVIAGDEPGVTWYSTTTVPGSSNGVLMPLAREGRNVLRYDFEIRGDSMVWKPDSFFRTDAPILTRRTAPMPMAWAMGSSLANLDLAPLNPELGKYFGTAQGVLVINLPEDSKLGLKPGDVVLSVNSREIRSPGHLVNVLLSYGADEPAVFQVMRQKSKMTVTGTVGPR